MNKYYRLLTVCLIFCIVFLSGCSNGGPAKRTNSIGQLNYEEVKSARIELGRVGGDSIKNYTFDLNNSEHAKIIKDIVNYLNQGKVQGNADEKISNKGSSPTILFLEFNNGSVIQIKSAVGARITKLNNGSTEIAQFDIPNEITISVNNNEKPFRMLSPEIKKTLESLPMFLMDNCQWRIDNYLIINCQLFFLYLSLFPKIRCSQILRW